MLFGHDIPPPSWKRMSYRGKEGRGLQSFVGEDLFGADVGCTPEVVDYSVTGSEFCCIVVCLSNQLDGHVTSLCASENMFT